jgi:uncharacterized protein YijF (DUF1287 family)
MSLMAKLLLKFFTPFFWGLCLLAPLFFYQLGYFGEREFDQGSQLPEQSLLVENAKRLIGTPYDPLMGKHDNIGSDLGFMVCSDVPNIAYGLSGYSIKLALAQDFRKNPSAYDARHGNNPANPYFHRRARNLYAFFKSRGKLKAADAGKPKVGDLAFYRKTPKGYIAHVALVSQVTNQGYKLIESAPKTLFVQEVSAQSPIERGWILVGFGQLY